MGQDERYDGSQTVEMRPLIGLTSGLPDADLEHLTVDAILKHRRLAADADDLFQQLPENIKHGRSAGGPLHREYLKAMMAMHAQMSVVSSLLVILGRVPAIPSETDPVR